MTFVMPDVTWLLILVPAMAATGLFAGFLAGLFGVGGGIVIVPVLSYVLPLLGVEEGIRQKLAVATSLATMIPTSWISARKHRAKGAMDVDLVTSIAPAMVVGTLAGAALVVLLRGEALSLAFAAVALLVAANLGLTKVDFRLRESFPRGIGGHAIGAGLGLVSALMGIGGGTVGVPVLTMLGLPMIRAVATASAFGLVIAIPATIVVLAAGGDPAMPPLSVGYVSLIGVALIAPFSMLATPLGVKVAHGISPLWLKRAFAIFLAITALRMFHTALT
ncbi:MAG: sulfite exporter TauE/SafE family protein [Acetobacteraceae bacterium]|jgi:uncharacterized membrane protein YfcA|nr:sulfite exporter TauE/SafE family protein [Acetobacteraceae bacterium]